MEKSISLPHKVSDSECYVNGIEDLLTWKGGNYVDHLLSAVGGMASFSYLKFKRSKPSNLVFWGTNARYLVQNLERIIGFKQTVLEGRSSSTVVSKLEEFIRRGVPVVAGALDMYYLHYYPKLYRTRHIPIHYLLVVGFDTNRRMFRVHDCGRRGVQEVSYEDLRRALDVAVPGMSRKNTLRVFKMPSHVPSELDIASKGFRFKAGQMLRPPVAIFGIPAMRRLSKEVLTWKGKESFEHMVTYATAPPALPQGFENSHGMRPWQAAVLGELSKKYRIDLWNEASTRFEHSGKLITELCGAAMSHDRRAVSALLGQIADDEEKGYHLLEQPAGPEIA